MGDKCGSRQVYFLVYRSEIGNLLDTHQTEVANFKQSVIMAAESKHSHWTFYTHTGSVVVEEEGDKSLESFHFSH